MKQPGTNPTHVRIETKGDAPGPKPDFDALRANALLGLALYREHQLKLRLDGVVKLAVGLIGAGQCEEHSKVALALGLHEFTAVYPQGCMFCYQAKIAELEAERQELIDDADSALLEQLNTTKAKIGRLKGVIYSSAESIQDLADSLPECTCRDQEKKCRVCIARDIGFDLATVLDDDEDLKRATVTAEQYRKARLQASHASNKNGQLVHQLVELDAQLVEAQRDLAISKASVSMLQDMVRQHQDGLAKIEPLLLELEARIVAKDEELARWITRAEKAEKDVEVWKSTSISWENLLNMEREQHKEALINVALHSHGMGQEDAAGRDHSCPACGQQTRITTAGCDHCDLEDK